MKIVALIGCLVAIGVVGYLLVALTKDEDVIPVVTTENSLLSSDEASLLEPVDASGSGTADDLQRGGSSYLDSKGVFVFLYPNGYTLDAQPDGTNVRIYKTGATQKGQTEMYDGVIVAFETIELKGKTLSEWVDDTIATSTTSGASKVVEPKKAASINNYNGFNYTLQGQGDSEYTVVQKDPDSDYAVSIVQAVYDPENVGFQAEVNSVLATLELLK